MAALLAACGSDDGSGEGTTGASGSEQTDEFLAAVDATCVAHAVAVNELSDRLGIPQRFSQNAPYDQARADAAADQAEAAAALEPPQETTADYEAYVANLESYADAYQENADLAAANDKGAWEASTAERRELGSEQIELAEALGLQACARKIPAAAEAAVMEVAERVLTGADPERSCSEDLTEAFIEDRLGGEERCVRLLGRLGPDGASLEFLFFTRVDQVLASANVNYTASADREAQYLIYDFIWDEGTEAWKLDSSLVAGPAEPSPSADPGGSA